VSGALPPPSTVPAPKARTALLACALALLPPPAARTDPAAASFKVVVNPGVRAGTVSRQELSDLFLKKTARWPAGGSVLPVDQSELAKVRLAFAKEVHQRSLGELRTYWEQRLFAGRGAPPLVKASDAEVLEFVRAHPGAVGYVTADAEVEGVGLLLVKEGP
jgi:hypothetical protein